MVAQKVKNLLATQETWVWKDPLEEGMAAHSSIVHRRIPIDRGTWRLRFMGSQESDTAERLNPAQYSTRNYIHYIVISLMEINLKKNI